MEPEDPRTTLKKETVIEGLSLIQRTAGNNKIIINLDGQSYAYSTLNMEEKEIQELGDVLNTYVHLQNVNLNKNDIRDISVV